MFSLPFQSIVTSYGIRVSMGKLRYVALATSALVGGSYANYKVQDLRRQPLLVTNLVPMEQRVAGVDMIAVAKAVFGMLPAAAREYLVLAGSAPSPAHIPRDTWELSRSSPYTVHQVTIHQHRDQAETGSSVVAENRRYTHYS